MDYDKLKRTVYYKPRHMEFFKEHKTNIQEFTRAAVDAAIEKQKNKGEEKKK